MNKIIQRRWVWIRLPEKAYFGRVTIRAFGSERLSEIDMVDPIPFRWDDAVHGKCTNKRTIASAVRSLVVDIIRDRALYMGDRDWRPSKQQLKRMWRERKTNRKFIMQAGSY